MPAYKYTLKDGKTTRWYANFYYTDWTGTKKHICKRGFKTQREAKEYERSFTDQQNSTSGILFSSLVENYMEDMSHRLKPTTMLNKRILVDSKILPYFRNLKVHDIDALKIRKWQNELISYRNGKGEPFSPTYLKLVNTQMSALMNYAVMHYGLPFNPCKAAGSIGKNKAGEMTIWTQAQYEQFSSIVQKPSMKLAFDVLFYTGMRSGELLALTPTDILPAKRININKNYAMVEGKALILEPKTPKSKRCISIPDFLYDDILSFISGLYETESDDRIFQFPKSALNKELSKGASQAELPPIRVHDLRHSHASLLINMGFSALEIAERLGHESVKTTLDIYSHLYPDKDQQLADRLNQFRRVAPPTR